MKIYETQQEVEKDIKDNILDCKYQDVRFECSISIDAHIINARDIYARDINARDINAGDISYYAFCQAYNSIKCTSIKARREKASEPICLDGELIIKDKDDDKTEEAMKLLKDKGYKIIKV